MKEGCYDHSSTVVSSMAAQHFTTTTPAFLPRQQPRFSRPLDPYNCPKLARPISSYRSTISIALCVV